MEFQVIVLRLGLSVLLGGMIGWEREAVDKPAGLRTLAMVCVGSTLFAILSLELVHATGADQNWDPLRIVAAIIQGVGFLGAGAVLQRGETIKGLTTAATLWAVTAVGAAVGFGVYATAILGAAAILVILRGLRFIYTHRARDSTPRTGAES
jgi:putative Mg2+ transporter-C (MgtC) family protein